MPRFGKELYKHVHAGRVGQDVESADISGVSGTPTFFVNGLRHYGAFDAASLTQAIATARDRARVVVVARLGGGTGSSCDAAEAPASHGELTVRSVGRHLLMMKLVRTGSPGPTHSPIRPRKWARNFSCSCGGYVACTVSTSSRSKSAPLDPLARPARRGGRGGTAHQSR